MKISGLQLTVRGIDTNTYNKINWSSNLIEGDGELYIENYPKILLGYGIQNELQIPYNEILITK